MIQREVDELSEIRKQKAARDGGATGKDEEDKKMIMATRGNLELIFPLVSYKLDFFIQDNFESEEKALKNEIEAKK